MSGRLIILPKKTYCPWNPQSLERVLRDERIEKERIETQEKQEHLREKHAAIEQMKVRAVRREEGAGSSSVAMAPVKSTQSTESENTRQQHVNLFEIEEEQFQRDTVERTILGSDGTRNNLTRKSRTQVGVLPVFLTDKISEESKKQSRPFYIKKDCLNSRIDDKLKNNMDPMRDFHSNEVHSSTSVCREGSVRDEENGQNSTGECSDNHSKVKKKRKRHRRRKDRNDNKPTETRSEERKRRKKSRKQDHSETSTKKQRSSARERFQEMMERQRLRDENELKRESHLRT